MPRLPKFTLVLKLIKVKNGSGGGGEYREAGISSSHEKAVFDFPFLMLLFSRNTD